MIINRLSLCKGEQKRLISYYQKRDELISSLSRKQPPAEQVFSLLEPLSYETIILFRAVSENKNFKPGKSDIVVIEYNGTNFNLDIDKIVFDNNSWKINC